MARESQPGGKLQGEKRGGNRNIAGDVPFWSPEVSGTRPHKQPRPKHSVLGSSPLIPALFLLFLVVLLPTSKWFRQSVRSAVRFPVIQRIGALIHGQKTQQLLPNLKVWINKQSGFYYCRGDILFGKNKGRLMAQEVALTSGYRPADGQYCPAGKVTEVSRNSEPSRKVLGTK